MKIAYLGGKQAGCIGLLTVLASGNSVNVVIAYDNQVETLANVLNLPVFRSIKEPCLDDFLIHSHLLVCVHGREIVPQNRLFMGGINVHPCLYRYKGAHPIERMLADGCTRASVGVHRMTEVIDNGETLIEDFVDVTGCNTVAEVYNTLYPYYSLVLLKALKLVKG